MNIKILGLLLTVFILAGCATTYRLEGNTYSSSEQFHTAVDALYRDTRQQLVSTMRVAAPISQKTLTVGIPTVDAIRGGMIMPGALTVTPSDLVVASNLSQGTRKELEMFAATLKDLNIYKEVKVIDTTGGHLQPTSTESVLYLYVLPASNASQWYINGG